MPNLAKQWVTAEAEDGTKFAAQVDVSVTTDGIFSVECPKDLEPSASRLWQTATDLTIIGFGRTGRVQAKTLKDALDFLKRCATDLVTVESTTERVIIYRCLARAHFWIENGKIHQNGMRERSGQWWRPTASAELPSYMDAVKEYTVGLSAAVFDKQTFKRSTGNTVVWHRVRDSEEKPISDLNGWVHLDVDPEDADSKEMLYSPEAAEFFHGMTVGLCEMARRLDAFIGDKKKLTRCIAERRNLLLTEKAT